jgi:O-antigen ligase
MFGTNVAKLHPVERAGAPRLPLLGGWLCAMLIGCLTVAHVRIAFGFIAFLALLCLAAAFPAGLAPALVVLSVFVERALQPLTITVGGTELLNFCGVVNVCLLAIIVLFVVAGRVRPFQSLVTGSFALYCAVVVLSLLFSVDVLMTARSIVRITAAYCIYLIITQFVTEKRQIDRIVLVFVLVSAIPIAAGLYQIVFENHFALSRNLRIHGTFKNGMSYAMYLALMLPYIFGQTLAARTSLSRKAFFAGLFLVGLVELVYTSTRIGWGVFAFAMILYGALANPRRLLPPIVICLALSVILFSPFYAKSFGGYFRTNLRTYFSDDVSWDYRSPDYFTASSLHIRIFVWRHMLRKLWDTNVWFGLGSGTWFEKMDRQTLHFSLASHSDYAEVVFGTGVVGLAAYLVFRVRQLLLLARFARSDAAPPIKRMILFPCLATHVACLGMSVTEVWQAYSGIYWLSWITFGISESYYQWYRSHAFLPAPVSGPEPDRVDDLQSLARAAEGSP